MRASDFNRKVKENVTANFDASTAAYQAFEERHRLFATLTEALATWVGLSPGACVLDVGCGNGISAGVLCERFRCRVLGVDLSPEMVAQGRRMLAGCADVRLMVGDAERLEDAAGDERFDAVLYNASIFIMPDVDRVIASAAARIVPGGTVAFSFYPDFLDQDGKDLLEAAFRQIGEAPPRFKVITGYEDACRALEAHVGPVDHHRWTRPLDTALVEGFYGIPAQSASLFPGKSYPERQARLHRLLGAMGAHSGSGRIVWRMATARSKG